MWSPYFWVFFTIIGLSSSVAFARLDEGSPSDHTKSGVCRVVAHVNIASEEASRQALPPGEGIGVCQISQTHSRDGITFPCTIHPARSSQNEESCGKPLSPRKGGT